MKLFYPILTVALLASGCASLPVAARSLTSISQDYVRLTLEAGTHEAEYVDAYYGPESLQAAAKASPRSLADLIAEARKLTAVIDVSLPTIKDDADRRRALALRGMLVAADTRLQMLQGRKFTFNDEAGGQFATVPVLMTLEHYDAILTGLRRSFPALARLPRGLMRLTNGTPFPKSGCNLSSTPQSSNANAAPRSTSRSPWAKALIWNL
jgi:hypothetical protein